MSIKLIAAIGKNFELGANNQLMWHLPADMKFFRETTRGATVIMGRLTYESIGRPLPNRRNIVITSNPGYRPDGVEVFPSLEDAISAASSDETVFIIGGARVYADSLKYADELILTELDAEFPEADVFFPQFDKTAWHGELIAEHTENGITYRHVRYFHGDI